MTKTIRSEDEMITKTFQSGKRLGHYNYEYVYVHVFLYVHVFVNVFSRIHTWYVQFQNLHVRMSIGMGPVWLKVYIYIYRDVDIDIKNLT